MTERSKLSALLAGVMSAVQKAATTAGQQNLYMLDHYFDKGEDGTLTPRCVQLRVSEGQTLTVPLLTLINPSGYQLDELSMALSLRMSLADVKKATHESLDHEVSKGSYSVELCPKTNGASRRHTDVVDVVIKFKTCPTAEGLMRIIEDMNNTITARKVVPVQAETTNAGE